MNGARLVGRQTNPALARRLGRALGAPRVVMVAAFGGASAINYAFGLVMAWLLLPGDFGLLAFAQTMLLIGGLVLNSGITWSLARDAATVDHARRAALTRGALLANLLLALALSAAVMVLFARGPLEGALESGAVRALVALALPPMAIVAVARASAQGAERFGVVATLQLIEIGSKAAAGTALVLLGFGSTGAVAGFVVGATIAALCGVERLLRPLRIAPRGRMTIPTLGSAGWMFGALLGLALLLNLDLIAMKLLSGDDRAATGIYQAGILLANMPYYLVASALVPVLFTRLSRSVDLRETAGAVGETLRATITLVLPIEGALILAPDLALRLFFPATYAPGTPTLRLLALGNCALIVVAILAATFQAVGRAVVPATVLLAVVAVESAVLRMNVPALGGVGAAGTFGVAALAALFALSVAYLRALDRATRLAAAGWAVRFVAASALGAGVGVGAEAIGVPGPVPVALGGTGYLATALVLGLIAPHPRWPHPSKRPATVHSGGEG